MTTLTTALNYHSSSPAIILPESDFHLSYSALSSQISTLQSALAKIGVAPNSAVAISLINSLEFAISFLAVGAQRAIAATLNFAYQQSEVEFYVDDIKAALMIVPRGAVEKDAPAVRAARKFGAGIAEIWWDGKELKLELKEKGKHLKPGQEVVKAHSDDVAVIVLMKLGTDCSLCCILVERLDVRKVRSRLEGTNCIAVPLTHRNLTRTMKNIVNTYKLTPKDRSYLVMPLFHVHGLLAGLLAPLQSGGTVIIPPKFSAATFWPEYTKYKATWYTAGSSPCQIHV